MSDNKLIRMANDIAAFFRPYGEAKAVDGIRHHIEFFWTPKMRADLLAEIAAGHDPSVSPLVLAATQAFAPAGASPVKRESAGPEKLGEIGASDAG